MKFFQVYHDTHTRMFLAGIYPASTALGWIPANRLDPGGQKKE